MTGRAGNYVRCAALSAVAALLTTVPTAAPAVAQAFQFAAIGDTGYSKKSEEEFSRMIAAMNREPLAFVIHVGDFEADPRPHMRSPATVTEPCTDESFSEKLRTTFCPALAMRPSRISEAKPCRSTCTL